MYAIGIMHRPLKDILADFSKPIPQEFLKQKPVFNKGEKSYITFAPWGAYVKLLLMYAPGYCWEVSTNFMPGKVIVEGKLTIKAQEGDFIYSAVGVENEGQDNFGDALYDAESSSLRRACAKAGLGLHLYQKQNVGNSNIYQKQNEQNGFSKLKSPTLNKPQNVNNRQQIKDRKVTEAQIKRLYAIARQSGLTDEEAKAVVSGFGYQSVKDILMAKYDEVIEAIKTAKVDNSEPWKNWKSEDDALAYAMNQVPDLTMNRITQEWNNLVPEECFDSRTGKTRYVKGPAWVKRIEELKIIPF